MPLAKLTRPRARGAVARPRLVRLLDRERHRAVTWVWGPPGAGKTTLVASYLEAKGGRSLWYQLDSGDDDLGSFFYHLSLAAPKRLRPLPLLTPEHVPALAAFTRRFFRELFARLRRPFLVVLDNFQDVSTADFHNVVREGLTQLPEGGRVLILSRTRPPAALARLRASQALGELDASVLRLTLDESRRLCARLAPRRLPRRLRDALHREADGWAAGLVLLVERFRDAGSCRPSRESQALEATFDYFAGEVFSWTDQSTREALLQLALLSRIPASLAGSVTEDPDAASILADLHRRSYFTDLHAGPDPVYEFHPLFRAFLRTQAETTYSSERLREVRRRAAALLETKADHVEEAVGLYREAGDWDGLARLVESQASVLAAQGRWKTIGDWLGALPNDVIETHPWLLCWRAQVVQAHDQLKAVEDAARAFARFRAEGNARGVFLAWAVRVDATWTIPDQAMIGDRIAEIEAFLAEGYGFPSSEVEARVVRAMTGLLVLLRPADPGTRAWIDRAEALARASQDPGVQVGGLTMVALARLWTGDLRAATQILNDVRHRARSPDVSPPTQAMVGFVQMRVGRLTGDVVSGRQGLKEGRRWVRMGGKGFGFHLITEAVMTALSEGNLAEARLGLAELSTLVGGLGADPHALYHYVSGWAALLQGDVARASGEVPLMLDAVDRTDFPATRALARIFSAHVHHEAGRDVEAWRDLDYALELARTKAGDLVDWPATLLEAYLHLEARHEREGLAALRRAMALGRARGYVNTYTWRPTVMARLCARALEAGIEPDYVRDLIRRRRLAPPHPPPLHRQAWPWAVEVQTLGRFEVRRNGTPLALRPKVPRKPLELLRALIAFGPGPAREAALTEVLWPDADGDAAQRALATTLFRLRRLLGREDAIARRDGELSLDPSVCWVDARALEAVLDQADVVGRDRRARGLIPALEAAVALYPGPFADGDPAPWAVSLRDRLRTRVVRVLSALGRCHVEAQDWGAGASAFERALEIRPTAEDVCRMLMQCHQHLGHPAAALAAYESCRSALATESGVAPAPATIALYHAIRGPTS